MVETLEQPGVLDTPSILMPRKEERTSGQFALASRSESWQKRISSVGWLSASMIHDLRNPVGTVFAGAEMLMELDLAPHQVRRLAANIYRAADRMRQLLAELAGASAGDRATSEICRIRDVIHAAAEAALPELENPRVQILNNVPSSLELRLERSRIERVFYNLMTNAAEAMPAGGKIRIGSRESDDCVLIEVEDTGPGIPIGIRDRLFEPFVTAGKDHGLGLGLAISRQTVLDHGGDMWIEPGAGARFVMRFPLTEQAAGSQRDTGQTVMHLG
jgi:signal transduction histidine kinase